MYSLMHFIRKIFWPHECVIEHKCENCAKKMRTQRELISIYSMDNNIILNRIILRYRLRSLCVETIFQISTFQFIVFDDEYNMQCGGIGRCHSKRIRPWNCGIARVANRTYLNRWTAKLVSGLLKFIIYLIKCSKMDLVLFQTFSYL